MSHGYLILNSLSNFYTSYISSFFCWTAQVLDALQDLRRCDSFVQAVPQGTPIPIQEFTDDLRHRLRTVWRDIEGVNPRDTYSKLATYQSLFDHNLSQHVMRNGSRFRLRAHALKVETPAWGTRNAFLCDCWFCDETQDEAHALLVSIDADVCAVRRKHAYPFNLTDIMLTGKDQSQADQPNSLAEGGFFYASAKLPPQAEAN
eukprot:1150187-Pelagomonas_calceolata.AAC.1